MECANGCGQEIRETEPRDGMFTATPAVPWPVKLHTYMVQQLHVQAGQPLRFSDGERVVAVLASERHHYFPDDWVVTFLVELPGGGGP